MANICTNKLYEFGREYVGFNIYTGGEWCDKLADR